MFGCILATCYVVLVNAFAGPNVQPQLVHQVAPLNSANGLDLEFQEASGQLRNALKVSGFNVGSSVNDPPDVVVLTEFGISEPKVSTDIQTANRGAWVEKPTGLKDASGKPVVSRTYETVGTSVQASTTTTYVRRLTAVAYDFRAYKQGQQVQLWKVSATSEGPSNDLRTALPVLMAAARPYFGKSSGKQVSVTLKENAPEVVAVRTGVLSAKSR
jgi:hypothetical protein